MALSLKFLTVPPIAKHTATVIFVHGLGDSGHGWEPVAQMFKSDPGLQHIKWVLPHSPELAVTANSGFVMPSWFDIYSFDFKTNPKDDNFSPDEDEVGMLRSSRQINELISAEIDAGMNPNRIVLGGFSQGGAMSLLTGLTSERKLGGIATLSAWLPLRKKFKSMMSQHATKIPIFWGHGSNDPLVPVRLCQASTDHLTNVCGVPKAPEGGIKGLTVKIYDGLTHASCPKELEDLSAWIKSVVPKEI